MPAYWSAPQEAAPIPYGKHSGTRRNVMPSVMDTPELSEYVETHDLTIETLERPQIRRARPGFWRTLAHTITTHLTPAPACSTRRPVETSLDWLGRGQPALAGSARALIVRRTP